MTQARVEGQLKAGSSVRSRFRLVARDQLGQEYIAEADDDYALYRGSLLRRLLSLWPDAAGGEGPDALFDESFDESSDESSDEPPGDVTPLADDGGGNGPDDHDDHDDDRGGDNGLSISCSGAVELFFGEKVRQLHEAGVHRTALRSEQQDEHAKEETGLGDSAAAAAAAMDRGRSSDREGSGDDAGTGLGEVEMELEFLLHELCPRSSNAFFREWTASRQLEVLTEYFGMPPAAESAHDGGAVGKAAPMAALLPMSLPGRCGYLSTIGNACADQPAFMAAVCPGRCGESQEHERHH